MSGRDLGSNIMTISKFDYNVCVSASEHFSPPFNSSYKLAFEIKCYFFTLFFVHY